MPNSSDSRNITAYANKQMAFIARRELLGKETERHIHHNRKPTTRSRI